MTDTTTTTTQPTEADVRLIRVKTLDGETAYHTEDGRFVVTTNPRPGAYGYRYHAVDLQRFVARHRLTGGGFEAVEDDHSCATLAESKRFIARQIAHPEGETDARAVVQARVAEEREHSRRWAARIRQQQRRERALRRAAASPEVCERMAALADETKAEIEAAERALHLLRRRLERAMDVGRASRGESQFMGDTYRR